MIMGLEPLSDKGRVRVAGPSKPRDGSGDPIPVSKDLMGGEAWSSSAALRQHKGNKLKYRKFHLKLGKFFLTVKCSNTGMGFPGEFPSLEDFKVQMDVVLGCCRGSNCCSNCCSN